ncbi:carbohydrate ABC transporter permease [Chengkuizengella axinellae]|uniref:Carbohydrate ABC transporter permease n=1 Tax=Chengkuizengella axinellae TaxID=3064388 RepID=A0ABT9J149_9BACL|nr:carbohydrate ABC transporter permease [Chengkuizengella sp. 2205SS18-9]MDP5275147.1 carbohydrate ABC transporter permease [Chengkuizengella sp. 2205SS18-9]
MKSPIGRFISYLFLVIVSFISVFPFYWMFVLSTRSNADAFKFPPILTPGNQFFTNLQTAWERSDFLTATVNTLIITGTVTVSQLFFCSLAAFALARLTFKGRKFLLLFIIITLTLPGIGQIPLYMIISKLNWINDLRAVIVPALVSAFGVFLIKQYIDASVHPELIESAKVDGARNFQTYYKIVLPIIKPGLATLAIITFMGTWNAFIWESIVLRDESVRTIQLAIRNLQGTYTRETAIVVTGAFVATLPLLAIFIPFSRQFIAGLAEGSVKG